jgi:hypothetical protein
MKFTLSLRTGGLMEDPDWHYDRIRVVEADNLREAKGKYAQLFGFDNTTDWNAKDQTYWGWSIVDMVEEMKGLQQT